MSRFAAVHTGEIGGGFPAVPTGTICRTRGPEMYSRGRQWRTNKVDCMSRKIPNDDVFSGTGSIDTDRRVLLRFYRTTGGRSWTHRKGWEENAIDLGSWYGVTTNREGRVVKLDLTGGGPDAWLESLGGNGAFGDFMSLQRHNPILTAVLDHLPASKGLRMQGNQLSGTIPKELGRLDALKELHLGGNNLSGAIPPELSHLGSLETMGLEFNKLSGKIPKELGRLGAIKELRLGGNQLSGTIPPELGHLGALENTVLELSEPSVESLRGTIPKELGRLGTLEELDLGLNKLSGKIPPELGQLGALKILLLFGNQLSGAIPKELGELEALEELSVGSNRLSGTIPSELGQLKALKKMVLEANRLSGCIPKELGRLGALTMLDLGSNRLSGKGTVPHELGRLESLKELRLMDNKLTGDPIRRDPPDCMKYRSFSGLVVQHALLSGLGAAEDALRMVTPVNQSKIRIGSNYYLPGNPWVMPPEGVVHKGAPAVNKYLLAVRDAERAGAEVKTLQLLKVVLIGSAHAGKTSLVNSIVEGRACATRGTAAEASTVGIDLIRHNLKGATIEFYDCAGQVDYYGMHQTFLTRRALYLLVWDASKCDGKDGEELDEIVHRDIMRWLFALHLRAPGCSVILVANKCDGSLGYFGATTEAVEERVMTLLEEWKERRRQWKQRQGGFVGDGPFQDLFGNSLGRGAFENPDIPCLPSPHRSEISLLPKSSLVSCRDGGGLPEMIKQVADHGATPMSVPPAWALALEFLGALRDKRAPLQAARNYLGLGPSSEELPEDMADSSFTTEASLSERWKSVVLSVQGELQSAAAKMAVDDPDGALEGALWISEFSGQILRFANGDGIFLDAGWVAFALKPVLDHKLRAKTVPPCFANARDELVNNGVLRRKFAEHLWSDTRQGSLSDGQMDALYRVIVSIGIAIPLEAADGAACPGRPGGRVRRDTLVIMRLPETCGQQQQDEIDRRVSEAKQRPGTGQVTLKWRFDSAGHPPGLVERMIASCHVLGVVEMGLCWRYGAMFKSRAVTLGGVGGRLYTFFIRYDDACGADKRVLEMIMFGPLEGGELWAPLRWIASSMVTLSREWPGVLWEGWLECAEHPLERTYLAAPAEARIGSPLFPQIAQRMTHRFCDCDLVPGGVLQLVRENLGNVVDTKTGGVYATEIHGTSNSVPEAEATAESASEGGSAAADETEVDEEKTTGPREDPPESSEEEKRESGTRTPESGGAAPELEEKTPDASEEAPAVEEEGAPEREEGTPGSTETSRVNTPDQEMTSGRSSESTSSLQETAPQDERVDQSACACYGQLFVLWESPAGKVGGSLFTTGSTMLLAGLALLGSGTTGWIVCFALTGLFFFAGGVVAVLAVRYKIGMGQEENSPSGTRPSGESNA
ncbi:unnamed protein product [Scytosiphon promiscuus]